MACVWRVAMCVALVAVVVRAAAPKDAVGTVLRGGGAAHGRVHVEGHGTVPVAAGWSKGPRVAADEELHVTLLLRQQHVDTLERRFWAVSTPGDPEYGQFLTHEQVHALVRPRAEHVAGVRTWLAAEELAHEWATGAAAVHVRMSAAAAERIFDVRVFRWEHAPSGARVPRADTWYSLPPTPLLAGVELVDGVSRMPGLSRAVRVVERAREAAATTATTPRTEDAAWPNDCGCMGHKVTPAVLRARYNVSSAAAGAGAAANNSMAVAEFVGQYFSPRDVEHFQEKCGLPRVPVSHVVGTNIALLPGTEASLDIEYLMAMAQHVPATFWSHFTYSLYDWIIAVGNDAAPPLVHSVSYGNDEVQNSAANMARVNVELQKIGARGISVIFASGDQGVWGRTGTVGGRFHPDFPGASPYVTAVGATQFAAPNDMASGERASAWSGGGFSDHSPAPAYQRAAVAAYHATHDLPPASYWNATGRGYPDVAVLGGQNNNYCVKLHGINVGVMGTSASAPAFAGMVALLNNARLAAGKPQLGFLNPWLYQAAQEHPGAFYDVVHGLNDANGEYGFFARAGWDPASGLGTPNFEVLETLL